MKNLEIRKMNVNNGIGDCNTTRTRLNQKGQKDLFRKYLWWQKRITFANIFIPFLGFIISIVYLFLYGISFWEILLLIFSYTLAMIGMEIGFHRLFAHNSFKTTKIIRLVLAVLGSMAAQGTLTYWVTIHRQHHHYSDKPGDPHSPYYFSEKKLGFFEGIWHAYLGWFFKDYFPNTTLYSKDLMKDSKLMQINRLYWLWVFLGLAIPGIVGGILTGNLIGVVKGVLWGGFIRIFFVHQIFWIVGVLGHYSGGRTYKSDDKSTNNLLLALPSFGNAWHNNHHAFPNSAILGLTWWQFDVSAWVLRCFEKVGLIWEVKTPNRNQIEKRLNEEF